MKRFVTVSGKHFEIKVILRRIQIIILSSCKKDSLVLL